MKKVAPLAVLSFIGLVGMSVPTQAQSFAELPYMVGKNIAKQAEKQIIVQRISKDFNDLTRSLIGLHQQVGLIEKAYSNAWKLYQKNPSLRSYNRMLDLQATLQRLNQKINIQDTQRGFYASVLSTSGESVDKQLTKEVQLLDAINNSDLDSVKALAEQGALTPFAIYTASLAEPQILDYVLEKMPYAANQGTYQQALSWMIQAGRRENVQVHLKHMKLEPQEASRVLDWALTNHQFEIAQDMVTLNGIKPSQKMLLPYIKANDVQVVTFLAQNNVSLNKQMPNGSTPMHEACRTNPQLLSTLKDLGGDINVQDAHGNTLLHISVFQPQTVKILETLGISQKIKNAQGLTADEYGLFVLAKDAGEEVTPKAENENWHLIDLWDTYPSEAGALYTAFPAIREKFDQALIDVQPAPFRATINLIRERRALGYTFGEMKAYLKTPEAAKELKSDINTMQAQEREAAKPSRFINIDVVPQNELPYEEMNVDDIQLDF